MRPLKSNPDSPDTQVRQVMLKKAAELFSQKGYASTTVREIVAAASVSKPVLYYYFASKEGIYLELMRERYNQLEMLIEKVERFEGSAVERLSHLCHEVFDRFCENIDAGRLLYSIFYGPPQGAPFFDVDTFHGKLKDAMRRIIRDGIKLGEFKKINPDHAMWTILGVLNITLEVQLSKTEKAIGSKGLSHMLGLIREGMVRNK